MVNTVESLAVFVANESCKTKDSSKQLQDHRFYWWCFLKQHQPSPGIDKPVRKGSEVVVTEPGSIRRISSVPVGPWSRTWKTFSNLLVALAMGRLLSWFSKKHKEMSRAIGSFKINKHKLLLLSNTIKQETREDSTQKRSWWKQSGEPVDMVAACWGCFLALTTPKWKEIGNSKFQINTIESWTIHHDILMVFMLMAHIPTS